MLRYNTRSQVATQELCNTNDGDMQGGSCGLDAVGSLTWLLLCPVLQDEYIAC
jgi:hypothetical protein